MGFLLTRASLIATYSVELCRQGLPEALGPVEREAVFILDGVGGFQFMPLLIRRVLREQGQPIGSIMFRWQFGLPGEIWTDLMWRSRNERQAGRLADRIAAYRHANPEARLHVVGYSGGSGIAVWACERLAPAAGVETLVLACPALSPTYNLGPALRNVRRCYALVSRRDRWILGAGTTAFGTVDRRFTSAAGRRGFCRPVALTAEDETAYGRLRQIEWTPALRELGHRGGHDGWASLRFLREHLIPLLHGAPRLEAREIW